MTTAADALTQTCEGCGEKFINIFDARSVCMECVDARARCVTRWGNKCKCPKSKRRESEPQGAVGQRIGRIFTSCARCLGTVSQIR